MALGREILFILKAKDDASKEVRKVKEAFDDTAGSADKAARQSKVLSGLLNREVGEAVRSLGAGVLTAFGAFADEAAESVKQTKALNAVLQSTKGAAGLTAREVTGFADSLARVTNFEDDVILRGENLLLTFTKIGKDVFPQATEAMLNVATAMRTDVQSAAIQLGKALNDPVGGIDALTRAGIQFTDAQKDMIQALVEGGDTAGAQRLILQELETQFGGLARATADSRTQMGNAFKEIQEEIGKTLLPAFESAAAGLLPVLQNVAAWVQENPELARTIGLVTAAISAFLVVGGTLVVTLASISAAAAALGLALGPASVIALAIIGLTTLVVTLRDNWEWMAQAMQDNVGGAIDYVTDKLNGLLALLASIRDQFVAFFELITFRIQQSQKSFLNFSGYSQGPSPGFGGLPAFADGGIVTRPTVALIGEEGPEAIVPLTGPNAGGFNITVGSIVVHKDADPAAMMRMLAREIRLQMQGAA